MQRHLKGKSWLLMIAVAGLLTATAGWAQQRYAIVDQDASGPGGSDQEALMILLQSPKVHLLGITVVTGDSWRDEEVAHTLRMLELLGRTDVPVVPGAVFPLLRSQQWTTQWEKLHGKQLWLGAWGRPGAVTHGPYVIPPLKEGNPTTKPSTENAAEFMVRMVHKYPHQVTIIALGPMTDVAQAINLDPHFAELTQGLVFMGGSLNPLTERPEFANATDREFSQAYDSAERALARSHAIADPHREFNLWFDPEASHIVLHAHWPSIVCTTADVSYQTQFTKKMWDEIAKSKSPAAKYTVRYSTPGFFQWDELAAAAWLDPTLIVKEKPVYMDVDLDRGYAYGDTVIWTKGLEPALGLQIVHAQLDVDAPKLDAMFVRLMTAPTPGSKNAAILQEPPQNRR